MSKKSEKIEDETKTLYVIRSESTRGGESIDPEDRWSSRTDRIHSITYDFAKRKEPKNLYDLVTVKVSPEIFAGDKVYLAIVEYSDGDTFGRSLGHNEIMGAFATYDEAAAELSGLENAKNAPEGKHYPWLGYFSNLTDSKVVRLVIED